MRLYCIKVLFFSSLRNLSTLFQPLQIALKVSLLILNELPVLGMAISNQLFILKLHFSGINDKKIISIFWSVQNQDTFLWQTVILEAYYCEHDYQIINIFSGKLNRVSLQNRHYQLMRRQDKFDHQTTVAGGQKMFFLPTIANS